MKSCVYASGFGLLAGLCAIIVYGYAVNDIKSVETCESFTHDGCRELDEVIVSFHSFKPFICPHFV